MGGVLVLTMVDEILLVGWGLDSTARCVRSVAAAGACPLCLVLIYKARRLIPVRKVSTTFEGKTCRCRSLPLAVFVVDAEQGWASQN